MATATNNDLKYIVTGEEYNNSLGSQLPKKISDQSNTVTIVFGRHCENIYNIGVELYDGRTLNGKLTDKGHLQAKELGKTLAAKFPEVSCIVVNSMQRTRETAEEIIQAYGRSIPLEHTDATFERNLGPHEGKPVAAYPFRKTDQQVSANPDLSFVEKMRFKGEEAVESFGEIWQRVSQYFDEVSDKYKGKTICIISHSGTFRAVYWHLVAKLGFFIPYESFKPENGSTMVINGTKGNWNLISTMNVTVGKK